MKRNRKLLATTVALGLVGAASVVQADVVTQWDMSLTAPGMTQQEEYGAAFPFDEFNWTVPGSLTDPNTGNISTDGFMPSGWVSYLGGVTLMFTDDTMTTQNGAMTWKERDTQGPGLSIVTGDAKGENCIMSAGWNPDDPAGDPDWWGSDIKQCDDPWQSSKRFKIVSYVIDGPLDLTFEVAANDSTDIYRILQKYGNQTGSRITGYTQELGFIVNGQFMAAIPGDGLAFSAKSGAIYDDAAPTPSSVMNQGELDSLMAHGLFGAPDKHHTSAGYFNPYVRGTFGLLAGETFITTTGLGAVHTDLFGEWLPSDQMKGAFYYDPDGNVYTDNWIIASCDGTLDEEAGKAGAANAGCDGQWMTYREDVLIHTVGVDADGNDILSPAPSVGTDIRMPIPVDDATISAWMADPLWIPGYIDDLANVNINAFLSIGNARNWPTYDGNGNASFTIRTTPTFDATVATTEPAPGEAPAYVQSIDAPSTVIE